MFQRKKAEKKSYDKEAQRPVIKASICTGERVAGFKDLKTGKFEEIMLIRDDGDLHEFMEKYDVGDGEISKEW